MTTLSSSATFSVASSTALTISTTVPVFPAVTAPDGNGRIVHPDLGSYDYEFKPDEWINMDTDAIIAPVWASTRTIGGAAHALWEGSIEDVVVEERWGGKQNGMSMPITQLRQLMAIWQNPVDPSVGYVQWFPNYINGNGYNVIPLDLVVGSAGSSGIARLSGIGYQVISSDDVVNYLDGDGNPDGWVTTPVVFFSEISE